MIPFAAKRDLLQRRIFDQTPDSKPDDYSPATYEVMLRARGQRDVQVRIAGYKIANFSPQAEETKQRVIQAAAKIKNASIQEFVRGVLAVGKLC
jgi:LPS O-antigen subunit length determinant protein (WzzB/FepE family)